jgi:hypothetical protein
MTLVGWLTTTGGAVVVVGVTAGGATTTGVGLGVTAGGATTTGEGVTVTVGGDGVFDPAQASHCDSEMLTGVWEFPQFVTKTL